MLKKLTALGGFILLLASPVSADSVQTPIDGFFDRQMLNVYGTLVNQQFFDQHPAEFPYNGFDDHYTGYHTAIDVEYTFPADAQRDIPVRAVADGTVIYAASVSGYGGVIVVRHTAPEPVTTLYGHVRLSDAVKVGQTVRAGDRLASLGTGFSTETSGARKHLHFAVHKGSAPDLNGYEQSLAALNSGWYNPDEWLARYGVTPAPAVSLTATASPLPTTTVPPKQHKNVFQKIIDFFRNLF